MTYACVSWDDPAARAFPEPVTQEIAPARPVTDREPDDDELLRRIGENDQLAFRTLVERHVDRAFALALRILDNRADADDVVQDTLLKVWTHRHRWECGRAKFSTWLYRVVTNRCIDLRRRPRSEDVEAVGEVADAAPDAVTAMHRSEVSELLDVAMNRLPDQQRIAIILSYHEAMSNAEIADVMDTTVSAVESLLKRARQQLRKLLRRSETDIRQALADD